MTNYFQSIETPRTKDDVAAFAAACAVLHSDHRGNEGVDHLCAILRFERRTRMARGGSARDLIGYVHGFAAKLNIWDIEAIPQTWIHRLTVDAQEYLGV